jgi:hypothetical protein
VLRYLETEPDDDAPIVHYVPHLTGDGVRLEKQEMGTRSEFVGLAGFSSETFSSISSTNRLVRALLDRFLGYLNSCWMQGEVR